VAVFPIDLDTADGYRTFLRVKGLPSYRFVGRTAVVPDEYAPLVAADRPQPAAGAYAPRPGLFDYQRDIARLAVRKRKFAVFADCGLGKTLILLEFARQAAAEMPPGRAVLIVSPLMVVGQTAAEAARFYGPDLPVDVLAARDLPGWLAGGGGRVGITNYDAITDRVTDRGRLGAMILDESSMLKSHYGRWGQRLVKLGRGLDWKMCLTGTPAPNDRIEYANHAVFLDRFPTVNSFLAKFFVNRGETGERWELKPHALRPFYRALSDWSIFLTDPAVYGWRDNTAPLPPIRVHIQDVPLTAGQRADAAAETGDLFGTPAGIGSRAKVARIAKRADGAKPGFVADLCDRLAGPGLVWCRYNAEQSDLARRLPAAANVAGDTPVAERVALVREFQAGGRPALVTKPKILGFGLNLQAARWQVFSTLQDSYEEYYQAVKRSNRYGSTAPLDVYIPVTDLERPMVETVLAKAARVEADTREQQQLFREVGHVAV
jgi:superfamily II DNA or RNA helicase